MCTAKEEEHNKKKEVIYCVARYILVDYEERRKKLRHKRKTGRVVLD